MLSHAKQGSQRWAIMNSLSYRQYSFSDKPIANMIEYKDSSEIDRSNMESDLFFPIAIRLIRNKLDRLTTTVIRVLGTKT